MIVRTAVQVVSVDSIEGTAREVERIVAGVGGFVERANIEDMKASLQCRVPAARLEQLMDRVSELGGEKRRSVSATDVSEQYTDLEARLRNSSRTPRASSATS